MLTPKERNQRAMLAALIMWSRTPDRTERTERGRANGPGSDAYWLKLTKANAAFANATDQQIAAAAAAAKKAHFLRLALLSAKARRGPVGRVVTPPRTVPGSLPAIRNADAPASCPEREGEVTA